jgi:putrescine transport system ATP-binding protein
VSTSPPAVHPGSAPSAVEAARAGRSAPAVEIRSVSRSFDSVDVLRNVSLTIARGEFVALLGGSGCGKTTLLRIIAGLESPDAGSVLIGGNDVTSAPPFERPVNMMFQSYALFPHLTVGSNIEYGLRAARVPVAERRALVSWALALVRLEGMSERKPDQLSGGQRQRVALARCLVKKPAVLLLDEPMAALDRGLREEMQRELVRIQRDVGSTFVLVTHDQDEALSVADRIAVMDAGRIVQCGTPSEIYDRPSTRLVARFVGRVNLFDGRLAADGESGAQIIGDDGLVVRVAAAAGLAVGVCGTAAVRPEKITVSSAPTALANDFAGTVEMLAYFGDTTRAAIRLASGRTVEATLANRRRAEDVTFVVGEAVHVGFDAAAAVVLTE